MNIKTDPQKSYRKYTVALMLLTAAAMAVCAMALSLKREAPVAEEAYASYYSPKPAASQETEANALPEIPSSAPSEARSEREAKASGYLVTVFDGKIGVFEAGESRPVLTAETPVSTLPEEDMRLLQAGIRAETLAAARRILEDYQ